MGRIEGAIAPRRRTSSVTTAALIVLAAFAAGVTTLPPPASALTYYSDDFESGGGAWTTTGWWHWVDDGADPCRIGAFSGTGSFGYHIDTAPPATPGNACTYDEDGGGFSVTNSGTLTSPSIDLTTAGSARLTFMSWLEDEAAVGYEGLGLLVSDTGGASWVLTSFVADDPTLLQRTWEAREFDLTPWAGRVINLRFSFDTRDPATNFLRGWFIDDVAVDDVPASTLTFFADNFDTGSPGWVSAGQWHQVGPADTCGFGARSPPTYWGYHLDFFCDYDSGGTAADRLESPPIDLVSATSARLSFWSIYGLDNPPGDTVVVQVFNGASWVDALDLTLAGYPMNGPLYVDLDLTPYVGGVIMVGFIFSHDTSVNNAIGWFIDDVAVRGQRHTLTSAWQPIPPVPDGVFGATEHLSSPANTADLTVVPGNALWAYLIVENDPDFLYITYDVPGDTVQDPNDIASLGFDTDRDLAPTDGADDQLAVDGMGLGDHRVYSTGAGSWISEDPCDPLFAGDHTGLRCAAGFGPSPYSGTDHRIYEFRIPLALLDVPLPVPDGYLLGALGASSVFPGVMDGLSMTYDTWPVYYGSFPPLVEFGDIALAGSPGPCSSLSLLPNDLAIVCPTPVPTQYFGFDVAPVDADHAVVGLRPPAGVDYDLEVFPDTAFVGPLKSSVYGAGAIDFIGVRGASWAGSTLGAAAFQAFGTGDYTIEMEHDLVDVSMPGTSGGFMNAFEVLDAFDIDGASPGTTYEVTLTMDPFLDLDLYVIGFTSGSVEGRQDAWITSEQTGNGVVERGTFTPFSTGPFLVVVTNPIAGAGAYTLTISDGLCPGLQFTTHSSPITCDTPTPPDVFDFYVGAPTHAIVGLRPPVTGDYHLSIYDDTTFANWVEASVEPGSWVDFVALNGLVWSSLPTRGAQVVSLGGSGDYQIEMENSMPFVTAPSLYSEGMDALPGGIEVLDSVQLTGLSPGTDYRIDLTVPPSADLDLFLIAFLGDSARSRIEANWVSSTGGAGAGESITFTAPIAGDYLIVVTNEHVGGAPGTGPYDLTVGFTNQAPVLSATGEPNYVGDGLDPETGFMSTPYTYRVVYTDADNDAPAIGAPTVSILQGGFDIGGSPFTMSEDDPLDITFDDGKIYTFTTALPVRALDYTYYFSATDAPGAAALPWPGPAADAPDVGNSAPVISYSGAPGYTVDGVEFDVGTTLDLFTFEVLYQDADNDAPTLVYAYVQDPLGTDILGSPFPLALSYWMGTPGDHVAGAVYGTLTSLPPGSLWHGFWAEDGIDSAVGTALSFVNLPTVLHPLMVDALALAPATVTAGQTDVPMLQLTLSAFTNPITVDAVTLELSGLPPDPADVAMVTLWLDDGDGLFDPLVDAPIGSSSAWAGSPSTVTVDLLPDVVVSTLVLSDLFVTFDIAAAATGGHWIGVRLDTPATFLLLAGGLVMPVNFPIETYAPGFATQIFLPPGPPTLSYTGEVGYVTDGVELDSGPRGAFTFRVLYQDGDNVAPAFVRLALEKGGSAYGTSPYVMAFDSWIGTPGDYVSGARYQVAVSITSVGTDFAYRFEANDSTFDAGGPAASLLAGPTVVNQDPSLTLGAVAPTTGATGTAFNWTVTYTDPDDDAPAAPPSIRIRKGGADLPGSPFAMVEADALDTLFSDGKEYAYGRTLVPCGTDYDFLVSAADSLLAPASPLGPIAGPDVTGCTGTAPVLDWTGEVSYVSDGLNPETGTTLTSFGYRVKYRDADGDAPLAGGPSVHVLDAGAEIAGSPFTMTFSSWVGATNDYVAGALFNASLLLPAGVNYTYYFDATDAAGNPVVFPATPLDAPDVTAVPNGVPIADAGVDQAVFRNALVGLDGASSSDPDAEVLSFSWALLSGPTTPTLTGPLTATPSFPAPMPGTYVLRLTVNDGRGGTDTDDVSVVVTNRAPVIGTPTPETPVSLPVGGNQVFTVTATELDGDTLTYSWTVNGVAVGSDQPTYAFNATTLGAYTIVVTVSDGITADRQTHTWTVTVGQPAAPADYAWLVVVLILGGVVAAVLLLLWFRRRKKPEEAPAVTMLAEAPALQTFGGEEPAGAPGPAAPAPAPLAAAPAPAPTPATPAIAPAASATAPAASPEHAEIERKLTKLKKLRDSGMITEEEFQRETRAVLDKI